MGLFTNVPGRGNRLQIDESSSGDDENGTLFRNASTFKANRTASEIDGTKGKLDPRRSSSARRSTSSSRWSAPAPRRA